LITLKSYAVAIISNEDNILLMKRNQNRIFAPGLWTFIGGHIEPSEINNPKIACLREISEETGLEEKQIDDLLLKYIIMRKSSEEIRIQYIYIGSTKHTSVRPNNEGKLYWVSGDEVVKKELSFTSVETYKHYLSNITETKIFVGIVNSASNKPIMNWTNIEDWDSNSLV